MTTRRRCTLYRAFLADPDAFLHYLSEDDEEA